MATASLETAVVLLFVLVGGFFAAAELALVSLRDGQVAGLAERGRRGARVVTLRADSTRFLAAVQVGVTTAGFFSAAYGASTLAVRLEPTLERAGLPSGVAATVSLVLVTIVISYVSLVFGELVPKRVALQRPEQIALLSAPTLHRVSVAARPVIWLLSRSTNAVVRLLGLDPKAGGEAVSEAELRELVGTHEALSADERHLLTEVLDAGDRQVSEVMVPRTSVDFLDAATPLDEAAAAVLGRPHSRYPVIADSVDDVLGFVHVRDLLGARVRAGNGAASSDPAVPVTVGDLVRRITVVPGSARLLPALATLRENRAHVALVVDEYGGTDGIVTMEDLLEELVGEISDEYDVVADDPRQRTAPRGTPGRHDGDGGRDDRTGREPGGGARPGEAPDAGETGPAWPALLDARSHRDEVRQLAGLELPDGPFESLGGFVMAELGRVPAAGDAVEALGYRFTVSEVEGRRPVTVEVTPVSR